MIRPGPKLFPLEFHSNKFPSLRSPRGIEGEDNTGPKKNLIVEEFSLHGSQKSQKILQYTIDIFEPRDFQAILSESRCMKNRAKGKFLIAG